MLFFVLFFIQSMPEEEGPSYLPHLVVDHHIVGLHIPVHDAHTMTVVQSLRGEIETS